MMVSGYTAYFDASSGHKDQLPGTWVCGFASTVSAWQNFEIDWKLALIKYGVPFFHMRNFIANSKPFHEAKWKSEAYRAAFISDLCEIIRAHVICMIGRGLWHTDFDFVNKTYELDTRYNPYAICGFQCAARTKRYLRDRYSDTATIEFVFERGDEGHGFLTNEMLRYKLPAPIFRPSRKLEDKAQQTPAIQLQACDFAAWEFRREGNRRTGLARGKKLRESFKALEKIEHKWMHYRHTHIEQFCGLVRIRRR